MTAFPSNEVLRKENTELRQALEKSQTTIHYLLRDSGRIEHRGVFHNCPAPECVAVRVLLGKEQNHGN